MSLSKKLQELRKHRGWSQDYVSKVLKINRSTISRYENGKSVPNYQTVLQFSNIYKVKDDFLVKELNQETPASIGPYILNESEKDPDIEIICQLAQTDKLVKEVFLELLLLDEKTRTSILKATQAFMKEIQRK